MSKQLQVMHQGPGVWHRLRKRAFQRFWGGRAAAETPVVLFLIGDTALADGLVLRVLETSLETDVYHSHDVRAFEDGKLRDDDTLRALIGRSRAPVMVFVLSNLAANDRLADLVSRMQPARALWIYDDYARLARKVGPGAPSRRARVDLRHRVDAQKDTPAELAMPADLLALARDESLDAACIEALLWHSTHDRFRQRGLHRQRAVHLFRGEQLRLTPKESMTALLESAGIGTRVLDAVSFDLKKTAAAAERPTLPYALESACDGLQTWLDQHAGR